MNFRSGYNGFGSESAGGGGSGINVDHFILEEYYFNLRRLLSPTGALYVIVV